MVIFLFFSNEYLQISANISDVRGFPQWQFTESLKNLSISLVPIAMVITWKLIFLAIAFGGRVCGWVGILIVVCDTLIENVKCTVCQIKTTTKVLSGKTYKRTKTFQSTLLI